MRWYVWPDTQETKGPEYMWSWGVSGVLTVCYETIKRQMKRRPIYECRWDERLGWQLFIMKHWKKRYIKDQRSEVTNFVMTIGHDHPWSRRHDRSWHMVTSLKVLGRSVRISHDLWEYIGTEIIWPHKLRSVKLESVRSYVMSLTDKLKKSKKWKTDRTSIEFTD
jgi:hypothetical protein